jgi:spore maturation protein CgeB
MNIGFMMKWPKGSLTRQYGNVIGDELLGESLAAAINNTLPGCRAELYAPNHLPKGRLDVMVYLNDNHPDEDFSKSHVLYLQNGGYGEHAKKLLTRLYKNNYDGYVFFSNKLLELHQQNSLSGIFLPFGVDLDFFKPAILAAEFSHDVAYVGNNIKGLIPTQKYISPALNFNFGLYGNWVMSQHRFKFWKNWDPRGRSMYRKLSNISLGRISQEAMPSLYSSSKINLNCTLQDCIDWDVITLRTYEVLACKGFLISDIVPVAKKTLDGCVVFTEGGEHLASQISYYLGHAREREEIAQNGYEYVLKNASITARAKELFAYLEEII